MSPRSILSLISRPPGFSRTFLFLLCLFFLGCVSSPPKGTPPQETVSKSGKAVVTHITARVVDDSTVVQIAATRSFKHLSYMLDKHKRLAIEIEGMKPAFAENAFPFQKGLVEQVTVNDFSKTGVLRLEVRLNGPADYDAKMEGHILSLAFTPRKAPDPQNQPDQSQQVMREMEIHNLKSEVTLLREKITGLEAQLERASVLLEPEPVKPELVKTDFSGGKAPDLLEYLGLWIKAWQAKDLEKYGSFYSNAFTHERQDKKLWLDEKAEKFSKAGKITVKMENPQVSIDGNWATVKFIQHYQSDSYKDVGIKVLTMKKEEGGWKIQSETWEPVGDSSR